jgi:hypothetical protein
VRDGTTDDAQEKPLETNKKAEAELRVIKPRNHPGRILIGGVCDLNIIQVPMHWWTFRPSPLLIFLMEPTVDETAHRWVL